MNRPTKPPTRQLLAATDAEFFGATTRHHPASVPDLCGENEAEFSGAMSAHHPASGAAPTYGSTGAVGGGRR